MYGVSVLQKSIVFFATNYPSPIFHTFSRRIKMEKTEVPIDCRNCPNEFLIQCQLHRTDK